MSILQHLGDNLWVPAGPTILMCGMPFPTRMVVIRLPDSRLWIWSPIQLTSELRAQIDKLGVPSYVVVPNKMHHLALSEWVRTWPALRLYAPPGLKEKCAGLRFHKALTNDIEPAWHGEIEQVLIRGSVAMTEVVFYHRGSRTCLVGDLIQKHQQPMNWWQRFVMKAGGVYGANGSTPRDWRLTFLNRAQARKSIERVLSWNPEHLVLAHGPDVMGDGAEVLRNSLRWLIK
jgi:hypothetical protein